MVGAFFVVFIKQIVQSEVLRKKRLSYVMAALKLQIRVGSETLQ